MVLLLVSVAFDEAILHVQVRFVHEVFRRLRPGVTVLALHSKMKYMKRLAMYESFVRKQYAVLFATDIAARGLGNSS